MTDVFDELRNDHSNFNKGKIEDFSIKNPFDLFSSWYEEAFQKKVNEPNAFSLSTVSKEGSPSSRIVYLKELMNEKFIFYTNYHSQKGKNIAENSNVSLLFFWPELERQIRIEGKASKVDSAISDAYFASRPRTSQIGAWASDQSEIIGSPTELEDKLSFYNEKYSGEIPRPPHWGGYEVSPQLIEFWQGRPSRLHDRLVFKKTNKEWMNLRKNP